MRIFPPQFNLGRFQIVFWGNWNGFGLWHYPKDLAPLFNGKPIFYGIVLGIIELRYFPKR